MANKRRKRSTKKIDKELNQLLKEKNKIDDLVIVKEKSRTSDKKKDVVVVPERKKKTAKNKDAIVTPERRSVSKARKKAQSRSIVIPKDEKKKLKSKNVKKNSNVSKKGASKRSITVRKEEKESLIKTRLKEEKNIIDKDNDIEDNTWETHSELNDTVYDDYTTDDYAFEKHSELGVHAELEDSFAMPSEEELSVKSYSELDESYTQSESFSSSINSFVDSNQDERNIYERDYVPLIEDDYKEDTGILVTDLAIRKPEDEPIGRKHNFLKIFTVILFIIFTILFIAFIAFIIYVCTY